MLRFGLAIASASVTSAGQQEGPCDIFGRADPSTPCVAAHSLTRALYGAYAGPLYQVRRLSDNATKDIGVQGAGGIADGAAQRSFCELHNCVVHQIYDQSPHHNHLHIAKAGGARRQLQAAASPACVAALTKACGAPKHSGGNAECVLCLEQANQTALREACAYDPACSPNPTVCAVEWCGPDRAVNATGNPVKVGGQTVYAAKFKESQGYRQDKTTGVAKGDAAETIYMVTSGTYYNDQCCFDCESSPSVLAV